MSKLDARHIPGEINISYQRPPDHHRGQSRPGPQSRRSKPAGGYYRRVFLCIRRFRADRLSEALTRATLTIYLFCDFAPPLKRGFFVLLEASLTA